MVSLPFLAGLAIAGNWFNLRSLAAALALLSIFLLRTPLLVLWRSRLATHHPSGKARPDRVPAEHPSAKPEFRDALLSLAIYGSFVILSATYLLATLPVMPLLVMGLGAAVLMAVISFLTIRNYQRVPALQIVSAIGLTASALPAYLAGKGQLDSAVYWIWGLFAAHSAASVLLVHARLEAIIASRKPPSTSSALPNRRNALVAQASLVGLLVLLAAGGRPWLIVPFLPPALLQWWELWELCSKGPGKVSMRRVGLVQLAASIVFCVLMIGVFHFSPP